MKDRWLFWVAFTVAFGLIMQAAHIGPTNLWITVTMLAVVLRLFAAGKPSTAGRR